MAKRSIKSSAIDWRHEPKGPGYAEHVYVTLTDGRRAELLAWDIPAHSDGSVWLDGRFDPDRGPQSGPRRTTQFHSSSAYTPSHAFTSRFNSDEWRRDQQFQYFARGAGQAALGSTPLIFWSC